VDIYTYLNQFDRVTKDPTLDTMKWIMNEFSNPQNKNHFIHVAGTNGKGSVCEMITSALAKAGYKVGKFISPYLTSFNEQITINNKPITDEEISEILVPLSEKIEEYRKEHEVKWFEITTSIALIYFAKKECDFVVLEAGLGGINDCTNIVNSDISIITSIGYDHMDILGDTIDKITTHKAGIIKEKSCVICQEDCNGIEIIRDTCKIKNAKLHEISKKDINDLGMNQDYQLLNYKNHLNVEINLKGKKQLENASICLECLDILRSKGYEISEEKVLEGLKEVVHPGRFEMLNKEPKIIFDGGHNEAAIANLKNTISQYGIDEKCYIFSILKTKDYETVLKILLEDEKANFIFTDGNDKNRYVEKEALFEFAKKMDNKDRFQTMELKEAIKYSYNKFQDKVIAIIGSFYIYQDVKEIIQKL